MSTGLVALLDDIAALAKVAAASLDDAASQAAKASAKAAGIVIDDTAVTPRYAVGFAAERELPIIGRIALGSLRNKLLLLLPAALVLALFAPWAITPLLMLGSLYLCFEGAEKIVELVRPHQDDAEGAGAAALDPAQLENQKINGAIKTDFILSAEIMAITLASVSTSSFWMQALVLAVVGIGMTAFVYGIVALIVKADDAGVALARNERPLSSIFQRGEGRAPGLIKPNGLDRLLRPLTQGFGRGLVVSMPVLLSVLGAVGTVAMLWVGGGILIHGLEDYGVVAPGHLIHEAAAAVARSVPGFGAVVEWLVTAGLSAVIGLAAGLVTILAVHFVLEPLAGLLRRDKEKTV